MARDFTQLKREQYPMPEYIKQVLDKNNVSSDYELRPAYQQNDYIGWIERAKKQETKEKRASFIYKKSSLHFSNQNIVSNRKIKKEFKL
jgi:uncharacterized protein YdeI (YjbR/CyaY-like superfamily)